MSGLFTLFLLAVAPLQATPHQHAPQAACPAPAPLPSELTGWANRRPASAAATAAGAPIVPVGRAIAARLLSTPVTYTVRPERPGAAGSHGGLFAFAVARAGRYRVALGGPAWIDVVKSTAAAASVAHGHGPDCTGVRKLVDFDLTPGRHLLQIAGSSTGTLPVMIVRLR